MGLKTYRPVTPTQRHRTGYTFEEITRKGPYRRLTEVQRKNGGRNNTGRLTVKCRGGGERQHYRVIDFERTKRGVPGKVVSVEYDPNRSARIALVSYIDGDFRYILHPEGLSVGDAVGAGPGQPIRPGNAMPLGDVPVGVEVHNIQILPRGRSFMVRSAGTSAQLLAREEGWAVARLPSGELRRFALDCYATIGKVSNVEHKDVSIGKAGRNRHRGWRPRVRAVAMNPIDHPMGGGEGKSSGGRHPCSESGFPAKGAKTRNPKKKSSMLIVQRRKR